MEAEKITLPIESFEYDPEKNETKINFPRGSGFGYTIVPGHITKEMVREAIKRKTEEAEKMTLNEYQKLASRTINPDLNLMDQMKHALYGLPAEVGEITGLFQKVYQGHELDKEKLKKEIGDVMWMVAELCTSLGLRLGDIAQMNIDKLKARYPKGFEAEKSLHRAENDN